MSINVFQNPDYYPIITGVLAVLVLISLISGWKKGFLVQVVHLAAWIGSLFGSWYLTVNYWTLALQIPQIAVLPDLQRQPVAMIVSFIVCSLLIRMVISIVLSFIKALKKIKVVALLDHFFGLLFNALICFVSLSLLTLFLQLPIVSGGSYYVKKSPLSYIAQAADPLAAALLKGEDLNNAIQSIIETGTGSGH